MLFCVKLHPNLDKFRKPFMGLRENLATVNHVYIVVRHEKLILWM
jgi:hypothetical protein